jgi:Na+-driven multidrug efflux pump
VKQTEINCDRILNAPVGKTLISLTIPMVFGILSMVAHNLADTFFVGQLGKMQLR